MLVRVVNDDGVELVQCGGGEEAEVLGRATLYAIDYAKRYRQPQTVQRRVKSGWKPLFTVPKETQ